MADSSTGGPLVPTDSAPPDDDALDDFFQAWVVGITAMPGQYVRPRFQQDPPALPARTVSWAAVGVVHRKPVGYAAEVHNPAGDGSDAVIRHEVMDLLCSFYGPNAQANAEMLQLGAQVAQNREALQLAGMGLVDVGEPNKAPELIKNQWLNRTDLTLQISRAVQRTYPVLNLTSGKVVVTSDTGTETTLNIT